MTCLLKIKAVREELSGSEKKIADFILANSALIRDYSSQHLAGSVGVSQSSVVKFSQKLGYRGFTDLKLAIHEAVVISESGNGSSHPGTQKRSDDEHFQDQLFQAKHEALVSTMQLNEEATLMAAVEALEQGQRIQIVALGAGSLVARNLASMLVRIGKPVVAEMDSYNQLASVAQLGKGDVVFLISFSGQSSKMVQIARAAKKAGAVIVSLTNYSANPLKSLADIQLFSVSSKEAKFAFPLIIEGTSQQHVADLLFSKLLQRSRAGQELLVKGKKLIEGLF